MFQTAGEAMTSSTSANYPVSPFLFQHVPSSPFLRPAKIRSPVPSVPDIDNQIASSKRAVAFIPSASPGPVVPSTPCYYLPISPAPQIAKGMQTPMSEQIVPSVSPFVGNPHSPKREVRQLNVDGKHSKSLKTIDLFSGDDIFG